MKRATWSHKVFELELDEVVYNNYLLSTKKNSVLNPWKFPKASFGLLCSSRHQDCRIQIRRCLAEVLFFKCQRSEAKRPRGLWRLPLQLRLLQFLVSMPQHKSPHNSACGLSSRHLVFSSLNAGGYQALSSPGGTKHSRAWRDTPTGIGKNVLCFGQETKQEWPHVVLWLIPSRDLIKGVKAAVSCCMQVGT